MTQAFPSLRPLRALGIAAMLCAAAAATTAPALAQLAGDATARTGVATTDVMHSYVVEVQTLASKTSTKSVNFTGSATIKTRLSKDPDRGNHSLMLYIDMSGATGQGDSIGTRPLTQVTETFQRAHAPTQAIEFPFPIVPTSSSYKAADVRTGMARFSLNVDPASGKVTSAVATLSAD